MPAGTTALRAVLEVTVVGRGCPLSSTTEPGKNPLPLTVMVLEPGPPMMAGETNTIVGALEVTVGVTVSMVGVAVAPATVGVDVAPEVVGVGVAVAAGVVVAVGFCPDATGGATVGISTASANASATTDTLRTLIEPSCGFLAQLARMQPSGGRSSTRTWSYRSLRPRGVLCRDLSI